MARSFSPLVLGFAILSTGAGSATAQSIPDMRGGVDRDGQDHRERPRAAS